MPWLMKDQDCKSPEEEKLLLVHVPRCGGTSLIKLYHVEHKSRKGESLYQKFGLIYFFYRYRLLENTNFPFKSFENLYAFTVIIIGLVVYFSYPEWGIASCITNSDGSTNIWCPPPLSISFWVMGIFTFTMSTFFMVAAVLARNEVIRRVTMWIFGNIMCGFGSTISYLHGVSYYGYLMHFTAEKMVRNKFIEKHDLEHSFAIVRNPYSRMVSIFGYNRWGPLESFDHFVRNWYKKFKKYKKKGSTDCKDVYCHVLPMYEFTHWKHEQWVPHVIKQEHLKYVCKNPDPSKPSTEEEEQIWSFYDKLPPKVLHALRNMPHSNKRKTSKKWYDMYTQELMDMVLEMYQEDFIQFSYDTRIPQRPDLVPKLDLEKVENAASIQPLFHNYSPIKQSKNNGNNIASSNNHQQRDIAFSGDDSAGFGDSTSTEEDSSDEIESKLDVNVQNTNSYYQNKEDDDHEVDAEGQDDEKNPICGDNVRPIVDDLELQPEKDIKDVQISIV